MAARLPRLVAVSDRRALAAAKPAPIDRARWLRALGEAGVDGVQLREKDLDDLALFDLAREARGALPAATRLFVNGRADVAVAAGADGVHLPADGLPVAPLKRRFGAALLVGRSTHRLEEIDAARDAGADFAFFGPVFETPGKGPAAGLAMLERVAARGLAVYAVGGVTIERLPELAAAGAAGAAAIRLFVDLERLPEAAARARELFQPTP